MTPSPGSELAQALSDSLSTANAQCAIWNANAIENYRVKHGVWAQSLLNHPELTQAPEPQPPMAWVVGYVTDPTSSVGLQWATPVESTHLACPPLPVPAPIVNSSMGSSFMQHFAGATGTALGMASPFNSSVPLYTVQVTAPDGSKFIRVA